MHKMGVRWTEYMESESIIGPHDVYYMVLHPSHLHDHPYGFHDIYHDHPGDVDHNHHISGAWSHELRQVRPEDQLHGHAQHE